MFNSIVKRTPLAISPKTASPKTLEDLMAVGQKKVMEGSNSSRAWNGSYFLNLVIPKLFIENDAGIMKPAKHMQANIDNDLGSVGIDCAEMLTEAMLASNGTDMPELHYFFKLIDSNTKKTIASDRPDYAAADEEELEDYLKPTTVSAYQPDPAVCAWLKFYVYLDGEVRSIATSNIDAKLAPYVDVVRRNVKAGRHMQAGCVAQRAAKDFYEQKPEVVAEPAVAPRRQFEAKV